jgi:hypothetical protein
MIIFTNPYLLNPITGALVALAGTLIQQAYTGGNPPLNPYTKASMVVSGFAAFGLAAILQAPKQPS